LSENLYPVEGLAGLQAVVKLAEHRVEQVAQGSGEEGELRPGGRGWLKPRA
jgi:hypothetical protein